MQKDVFNNINSRYTLLAEGNCCLSCGGAINYANAKESEICIDLGCGRGEDVISLATTVGLSGIVHGIDLSDGMIRKASITAEKLGIENAFFHQADLEALPFADNLADLIISNCTINHSPDKKKVWSEIFRVLRKGGRFIISDIYSLEEVPLEYRNDPVAISECWAGAVTKVEYFNQIHGAGFISTEIIQESKPYQKGEILVASITIKGIKR